jgi:nicotinate phosphoribosyltransferase
VADLDMAAARERVAAGLKSLPWDGLKLSDGEPAIPTRLIGPNDAEEGPRPRG